MSRLPAISLVVIGWVVAAGGQELPQRLGGTSGPRPSTVDPNPPVPRLPDGTIDLGGVWSGGGPVDNIERQGGLAPGTLERLMTPWAKQVFATRTEAQDPYNYCMPAGVPRMAADFAWRFIQYPTTKPTHLFLLYEANMHSYRQIFMDGRKHPEDPTPTWFDMAGNFHNKAAQVEERYTRVGADTLDYEVTITDPDVFARPWRMRMPIQRERTTRLLEYECHALLEESGVPLTWERDWDQNPLVIPKEQRAIG